MDIRLRRDPRVSEKLFSDLKTIKVLELPDGLERIGSCWFTASSVERVIIPARVREIGSHAFDWCKNLKEVIFQEGSRLEKVESYSFYRCVGLDKIELPNSIQSIGEGCFEQSGLKTFTFPESVINLGVKAF